jgi:hypothetical protein
MKCTRCVCGITFIGFVLKQKIGKPNNIKMLSARNPKGLNRRSKKEPQSQISKYQNIIFFIEIKFMFNNFIFVLASCNVILVHSVDNVHGFFLFTASMIIKVYLYLFYF